MDILNMAHNHLLLNHVPTVGTVIAIGLLLISLVRRNDHLKHVSLEVFFVVALLTIPAYLTGVAAQTAIVDREGVSLAAMEAHHNAALLAFILMQITGGAAWIALWQFRRRTLAPGWAVPVILLLSVLTLALTAPAATLGGEIRHPEIRITEEEPVPGTGSLTAAGIRALVQNSPTLWPAAETLHFLGLCLIFGILLVVNLRLMGFMRAIPYGAVHRLLPWGMLGFAVNLVTGMLFFIATPEQYTANNPFYWKILFLMAAGVNLLYITVVDKAWTIEAGQDTPVFDKAIGASAIVLWLGVIYWGRMLPFIGNAF
jgi:uncharacterized membrane protein